MALIVGNDSPNPLNGGAAADEICGLGGNDILRGGGGADTVIGGIGNDTMYGDDGNDVIGDDISLNVFQDVAPDSDVFYGGRGNDTLTHYQGTHFQDNDTLNGGEGNDIINFLGAQTNSQADGGTGIDRFHLSVDRSAASIPSVY